MQRVWTVDKLAELKSLAASGESREKAAEALGVSFISLAHAAYRYRVLFGRPKPAPRGYNVDPGLRERWLAILPGLKEKLRADLETGA